MRLLIDKWIGSFVASVEGECEDGAVLKTLLMLIDAVLNCTIYIFLTATRSVQDEAIKKPTPDGNS